jgi:hypothetical protein
MVYLLNVQISIHYVLLSALNRYHSAMFNVSLAVIFNDTLANRINAIQGFSFLLN